MKSEVIATSLLGSLFSTSLSRWNKDPGNEGEVIEEAKMQMIAFRRILVHQEMFSSTGISPEVSI